MGHGAAWPPIPLLAACLPFPLPARCRCLCFQFSSSPWSPSPGHSQLPTLTMVGGLDLPSSGQEQAAELGSPPMLCPPRTSVPHSAGGFSISPTWFYFFGGWGQHLGRCGTRGRVVALVWGWFVWGFFLGVSLFSAHKPHRLPPCFSIAFLSRPPPVKIDPGSMYPMDMNSDSEDSASESGPAPFQDLPRE